MGVKKRICWFSEFGDWVEVAPFTDRENREEQILQGPGWNKQCCLRDDQEFNFVHLIVGYTNVELKKDVWTSGINLECISI